MLGRELFKVNDQNLTASMASDPTGKYLYITEAEGIQAFTVDLTTGALTPIAGSPFPDSGVTLIAYSY